MKRAVVEKRFEYKGFPCVVIMQLLGFRTGYVGLTNENKYFGKGYDEIPVECNGGLTYAEESLFEQPEKDLWWIGFDAGHCWNGFDFKTALKLFKDDSDAVGNIQFSMSLNSFSNQDAMSCEDIENDCKRIVDQLLEEEEHGK